MKKADTYLLLTRLNGIREGEKQTLGEMLAVVDNIDRMRCKTIELPWRNNEKYVSCIPVGMYRVIKRHSAKYKEHFHILDVPDRSYILIHPANFSRQLMGCIAPGRKFADIDSDGLRDVTSSRDTLNDLLAIMSDEFMIYINHADENRIGNLDPKTEKRL